MRLLTVPKNHYICIINLRKYKMVISIAKQFSRTPGARYPVEADYSGQEFREKILNPALIACLRKGRRLKVDLDGTNEYIRQANNYSFMEKEIKMNYKKTLIKFIENQKTMLFNKNAAYSGKAYKSPYKTFCNYEVAGVRWYEGIICRMIDKITRLETIGKIEIKTLKDSHAVDDAISDFVCYCALMYAMIQYKVAKNGDFVNDIKDFYKQFKDFVLKSVKKTEDISINDMKNFVTRYESSFRYNGMMIVMNKTVELASYMYFHSYRRYDNE